MKTRPLLLLLALTSGTLGACHAARRLPAVQQQDRRESLATVVTPTSVTALRYRVWLSYRDVREALQGEGHWVEELWFPEWQLCANVEPQESDEPPRLNVFPRERPRASTRAGLQFLRPG